MITNNIPYGKQNITVEDVEAVINALHSDFLTQGPKINEFERNFANYVGASYAVAVANGTAALHLSALVMGIKEGDKVITSPITFAASANCVRYCGGDVTFADIDPDTYLLDIHSVRKLIESHPKNTFKGIIPVDFAGRAVDMEAYRNLANEFGLWIIEDACHSPGGYFLDKNGTTQFCGNGNFADLAVFSFHPVKHIACGEGGMITTNDEKLYKSLLRLRTHGIVKNEELYLNSSEFASGEVGSSSYPGWYMEMQTLGYNYRLTDFQAALGLSQLQRADAGLARRRKIAAVYDNVFKEKSFIKGQSGNIEGHAYHLYVIEAEDRLELYNFLKASKVLTQIHYIPCHLMPYYRQMGWKEGDMPVAEKYYQHCLSLPMYPTLDDTDQLYVINTIIDFYERY